MTWGDFIHVVGNLIHDRGLFASSAQAELNIEADRTDRFEGNLQTNGWLAALKFAQDPTVAGPCRG